MIINNINPNAKAARVFGLSNSWSPTSNVTIWTVTVVTADRGFAVRLAARPAAMTTIIVSPIALETASKRALTMPGNAAGKITFETVRAQTARSLNTSVRIRGHRSVHAVIVKIVLRT